MEEFLAYVASVSPDLASRMSGAPPQLIDEYEQMLGVALPRVYRDFLLTMGADAGGFPLFEDAHTSLSQLSDFHRSSVATGECRFPPGCIPVAVRGWTLEEACMEVANPTDGRVFVNADANVRFLYADTFRQLLFKTAFMALSMNRFPISGMYLGEYGADQAGLLRETATSLGYSPLWFSDSVSYCAETASEAVVIRQHTGCRCWLRVAAENKKAAQKVGKALTRNTGVKFARWWP